MRVDWMPVTEGLPDGSDDVLVTVQRPDEGDDLFVLVGWVVHTEDYEKVEYNVVARATPRVEDICKPLHKKKKRMAKHGK